MGSRLKLMLTRCVCDVWNEIKVDVADRSEEDAKSVL